MIELSTVRKGFLAGLLISIGSIVCVVSGGGIIGSFLFAIGLISVILLKADLYTGKVGYISSKQDLIDCFAMLVMNLFAAELCGIVYKYSVGPIDVAARLTLPWYTFAFGSMLCGALIYLAVEGYKKSGNLLAIIIPVMAFILGGGQHCIANAFYFTAAGFTGKSILYMVICIIGNAIGALVIRLLQGEAKKQETVTLNIK